MSETPVNAVPDDVFEVIVSRNLRESYSGDDYAYLHRPDVLPRWRKELARRADVLLRLEKLGDGDRFERHKRLKRIKRIENALKHVNDMLRANSVTDASRALHFPQLKHKGLVQAMESIPWERVSRRGLDRLLFEAQREASMADARAEE